MKVLIVEDEPELAEQLANFLQDAGFLTKIVSDGEEGLFEAETGQFDVILLDVGLPVLDGFSVLENLRKKNIATPVLMITARTGKMDTIRGLELGAGDYIYKPFDVDEVIARVRTNLRKSKNLSASTLQYQDVVLDTRSNRVIVDNRIVKLTRIEYLILQYLFMHQGKPISITEITDHVYDEFDNDSSIIPRHIANIRKKIGKNVIVTESNRGYYVPLPAN